MSDANVHAAHRVPFGGVRPSVPDGLPRFDGQVVVDAAARHAGCDELCEVRVLAGMVEAEHSRLLQMRARAQEAEHVLRVWAHADRASLLAVREVIGVSRTEWVLGL